MSLENPLLLIPDLQIAFFSSLFSFLSFVKALEKSHAPSLSCQSYRYSSQYICVCVQACLGCDGVRNSPLRLDCAGVCGGGGLQCPSSAEECPVGMEEDACGACSTPETANKSCSGCDGVPYSMAAVSLFTRPSFWNSCSRNLFSWYFVSESKSKFCFTFAFESLLSCYQVTVQTNFNRICKIYRTDRTHMCVGCSVDETLLLQFDVCGVCDGDGRSCLARLQKQIAPCNQIPGRYYDFCGLVCWNRSLSYCWMVLLACHMKAFPPPQKIDSVHARFILASFTWPKICTHLVFTISDTSDCLKTCLYSSTHFHMCSVGVWDWARLGPAWTLRNRYWWLPTLSCSAYVIKHLQCFLGWAFCTWGWNTNFSSLIYISL